MAKRSCTEVILPKLNEVFIDWDSRAAMNFGREQLLRIQQCGHGDEWILQAYRSRTPGHFHGVLTLPQPILRVEAIALSAILGGDLHRERLNYCRVLSGAPWPILFIEARK